MHEPPTSKQKAFLARLKYAGPSPKTKEQASEIIDGILASGHGSKKRSALRKTGQVGGDNAAWLRERRAEIREDVRENIADSRPTKREIAEFGENGVYRLAGWIIRIGRYCDASKHLDGLLVPFKDGKVDYSLLPPYDTCRESTCECEVDAVEAGQVPRGTRIAEKAGGKIQHGSKRSGVRSVVWLMIVVALIWLLWQFRH